jgi:AraC family transcriptional regulator
VSQAAARIYARRLQKVLRHIDEHLDEDLSLEVLSGVAAFSKYHFHRQFAELLGVGVARYVQLLRLKRAAYRLAFRRKEAVLQIALDSGYEGPEAFARAFKRISGQTPSAFRRQPDWGPWQTTCKPMKEIRTMHMQPTFSLDQVKIIEVKDIPVAELTHRGPAEHIGESIRRFIDWRKAQGLPPRTYATYNIFYDDPKHTPPQDFRLGLCVATGQEIAPNGAGVTAGCIPGGRCAVLRYVGSDDGLDAAACYLYAEWLPQSGEEPRDFPLYGQRVRFFPDVPEHEAILDLFLPLK